MSVRSDAKLFGTENKGNIDERFSKANRGRITEVEENDLELEGGANDVPQFEKNEILDPLKVKSAHYEVTHKKVNEAFDIMNILRANIDSKNFINEFLTQEQLAMLGQNKRNLVTFAEKHEDISDLIKKPVMDEKYNKIDELSCGASTNLSDAQVQMKQFIDQKLQ